MNKPKSQMHPTPLGEKVCTTVRQLSREQLRLELERYCGKTLPESAAPCDYTLMRIEENGLEFAWPMRSGSSSFYQWLGGNKGYYPESRWEYKKAAEAIKMAPLGVKNQALRVLDVGCGDGQFLELIRSQFPKAEVLGIDCSEYAARACQEKGIECFVGTIADLLSAKEVSCKHFDVITCFHTLEHVEDPLGLLRSMLEVRSKNGVLFVSTPLSPMVHELNWFDVQNHPPHHLTRWTEAAYLAVATELGESVTFTYPSKRTGPLSAFYSSVQLIEMGPRFQMTRLERWKLILHKCLSHWKTLFSIFAAWRRRGYRRWSNEILVAFKQHAD